MNQLYWFLWLYSVRIFYGRILHYRQIANWIRYRSLAVSPFRAWPCLSATQVRGTECVQRDKNGSPLFNIIALALDSHWHTYIQKQPKNSSVTNIQIYFISLLQKISLTLFLSSQPTSKPAEAQQQGTISEIGIPWQRSERTFHWSVFIFWIYYKTNSRILAILHHRPYLSTDNIHVGCTLCWLAALTRGIRCGQSVMPINS